MAEAEDAAVDLVESAARAPRRGRARRSRRGARPAAGRRAWSGSSGSIRRSRSATGCPEQIRRAGGWDLLGADGEPSRQTTWDAVAEVDPEMLFLMPCGFHLAETVDAWERTPRPPGYARPGRRPARRGLRARRLGLLQPARPAGHRRHRDAGRDLRPRRVRRHRAARVVDAGRAERRREPVPFRATFDCLWCGRPTPAAARTTSRAGRSSAPTASARPATTRSCGSGCARR